MQNNIIPYISKNTIDHSRLIIDGALILTYKKKFGSDKPVDSPFKDDY